GPDLVAIDASGNDPTPDQDNQDGTRVFSISAKTSIDYLTLTGGDPRDGRGGAVFATSDLTIDTCAVNSNSALIGGGICGRNIGVFHSDISHNEALTGGGIFGSSVTVVDCKFFDNLSGTDGGAIHYASNLFVSTTKFF